MGLRYRKSIRLGGGVRVNLSVRGMGWSVGGRGFRYTKPAGRRRPYSTVSIPGTGASYRGTSGNGPSQLPSPQHAHPAVPAAGQQPRRWGRWLLVAVGLLLVAAVPVAGPYLFWIAVAVLAGRSLVGRRRLRTPAQSSSLTAPAWVPPEPGGALAEQESSSVATPPLHQTGLADREGDADQRRQRSEQLRKQLDELG